MICANCGNECSDNDTECNKCGNALEDFIFESTEDKPIINKLNPLRQVDDTKADEKDTELNFQSDLDRDIVITEEDNRFKESEPQKKSSRALMLVIIAITVMIVCTIGSYVFISRRAMLDKFESALYNNEYDKAVELYNNVPSNKKTSADKCIIDKIEDIFDRYSSGDITSKEAVNELNKLKKINSDAISTVNEATSDFNSIIISESCFKEAEKYFESKDYENAIIKYYSVAKADYNYATAQKKMKSAIEAFKNEKFSEAEAFIAAQQYDEAITLMKKCQELLQTDADIGNKCNEYVALKLSVFKQDILTSADESIESGDNIGAFKLISDSIAEYGEDTDLKTKFEEYKTLVLDEVNQCIADGRYSRVVAILEIYTEIVTDDIDAIKLLQDYTPFVEGGYSYNEVNVKSITGKTYIAEDASEYVDAAGSTFSEAVELLGYKNLESEGEMIIENKNYNQFKAILGYSSYEYFEQGEAVITIKADDEVIYESPAMNVSSNDENILVDIPKCSEISISWKSKSSKDIKPYGMVLGEIIFMSEDVQNTQ